MAVKMEEKALDALPADVSTLIKQNMASIEALLMCVYYANEKGLFQADVRGVLVLTTHKFYELCIAGRYCDWPFEDRDSRRADLDRIKTVQISGDYVQVDYGRRMVDEVEWLKVPFRRNEGLKQVFHDTLVKAAAEAFARVRIPNVHTYQGSMPDIGDQLVKLAELRKNGAISSDEYAAAKRKLLS